MTLPLNWGEYRALCRLVCLCANLFFYSNAHAQATDSTRHRVRYRYNAIIVITGAQFQFFRRRDGLVDVAFPYFVKDASGGTANLAFMGRKAGIYTWESSYIVPFGLEYGWHRHFFHLSTSNRIVEGRFIFATQVESGWGHLWYFDPGRKAEGFRSKRWVIKASLNLNYTTDRENGKRAVLGSIDNLDKTIFALGLASGPSFTISTRAGTTTYKTSRLNISYSQRELALLPKIGFAKNPYHGFRRWELNLGYNLPLIDRPGIYLDQAATDGTRKGLADAVTIHHPGIVASYNGRPIGSAPFGFGGPYIQFALGLGNPSR